MIDPVVTDARRHSEVMWGGGNANAQLRVVYDGPDCLQPRCNARWGDVRCSDRIHRRGWGGCSVGARWLPAPGRERGIARDEGGQRAVVESAALAQPGAVRAQGEGGEDGDVRVIDQFA